MTTTKNTKITPVPAPEFGFPTIAQRGQSDIYDRITGRQPGPIHNVSVCALKCETLLVRTYAADPFRLVLRLGDAWHELAQVSTSDPGVQALAGNITEFPPSPAEIARREEAEEAQRKLETEQRKRTEARTAYRMQIRQEAEERERRARAAIQATR